MQNASKAPELAVSKNALPIAMRVANAMHKIGVVGLPRNYEIFYGAMSGTNPDLQKELFELGNNIDQEKLDAIFAKHCARADDEKLVGKICDAIEEKLGGVHHRFQRGYRNVINEAIRLNTTGAESWLALETSGHGALKENYFLDDGAYQIAKAEAAASANPFSSWLAAA